MKLIIAGSRTLSPSLDEISRHVIASKFMPTEIVCGGASGVDYKGMSYASKILLPSTLFVPDWEAHGKKAGPLRNKKMAEYADALLLIWDGKSKGSSSMKTEMTKLKKPIYEVIIEDKK